MRDSKQEQKVSGVRTTQGDDAKALAYDEKAYFESFYTATVRGEATDRVTLGGISEIESRFHYNCVENSIIKAMAKVEPPPAGPAVHAWRVMRQRRGLRLLDVGSGTGHWVDFMTDVFDVTQAVAVEITEKMAAHLEAKYADRPGVSVLRDDVADPSFTAERIGGKVNYVAAIGVMFHIVDDARWVRAIANLAAVLADDGLMIVGGDFGAATRDAQFHKSDHFTTWREHDQAIADAGELRVNKRLRSLAHWQHATAAAGLEIVDLVRSDRDANLTTAENDVLLLRRRA